MPDLCLTRHFMHITLHHTWNNFRSLGLLFLFYNMTTWVSQSWDSNPGLADPAVHIPSIILKLDREKPQENFLVVVEWYKSELQNYHQKLFKK